MNLQFFLRLRGEINDVPVIFNVEPLVVTKLDEVFKNETASFVLVEFLKELLNLLCVLHRAAPSSQQNDPVYEIVYV
jgi:hypothetical protein